MNDVNLDQVAKFLKVQANEVLSKALNEAVEKGIIEIRQSDPVIVWDPKADKLEFYNSVVLDYKGADKIEELEKVIAEKDKALAYLSKINGDLHASLSDFYEKTKVNVWLKNQ